MPFKSISMCVSASHCIQLQQIIYNEERKKYVIFLVVVTKLGKLGRKRTLVDRRPEENANHFSPSITHPMVENENKRRRKKYVGPLGIRELSKYWEYIWTYLHYTFFKYFNGTDIISSYVLRLLYVVVVVVCVFIFSFNLSFRSIHAVRKRSHAFVLETDSHM